MVKKSEKAWRLLKTIILGYSAICLALSIASLFNIYIPSFYTFSLMANAILLIVFMDWMGDYAVQESER